MAWIWLNEKEYPEFQLNRYNTLYDCENKNTNEYNYCVVEFCKELSFKKKIKLFRFRVSADNEYILHINDELIGIGPASAGGDFLCTGKAPKHYADKYELGISGENIAISSKVRLQPEMLTGYSRGHGGFYFEGEFLFDDGSSEKIASDSSWLVRVNGVYNGYESFDSALANAEFINATEIDDIWNAVDSYIPPLSINCVKRDEIKLLKGEKKAVRIDFDRIYGVYPKVISDGACNIVLKTSELEGQEETVENIVFGNGANEYMSFRMHSAGTALLEIENADDKDISLDVSFIATWYPITAEGSFETDNADLNKIYDVIKHTLRICRQTLHLDSTKHQELLACTGDYYIESLMTMFCYGDMRLAEFDLMRTADWICANNGVMFHTTYSLIWVQMLHDVYMITGKKELLLYCRKALDALLSRFESYIGENNVIDNPPDFMFVDWTVIDGFSMHHPPKALGQTVLNCFYYKALVEAEKIYSYIGETDFAEKLNEKSIRFKEQFNKVFFDEEKQLYFDGLGTPYGGEKHYHPANVNKKYFSKYPNILASLYGIADEKLAVDILERIIFDEELQDIQPYFMHYLLCAVRKYNLFDKYGMKLISRWAEIVNECDKGLKEGWLAPEEGYSFDHSHAWGGTPAYQLPAAITGFEIVEAGMKKIRFSPELYGLNYAKINIPTEYGMIEFYAEKGKNAVINAPEGIEIITE